MESCDGGEKGSDSITQNIRQVRVILQHVDPTNQNLAKLLDRTAVRSEWFVPFKLSNRRPGTVRSYCNSLRSFMDFLITTKSRTDFRMDDLQAMQTQARVWGRSLNNSIKAREYEKIYEDFDYITDPTEVSKFENSKPCREAIGIMEKFLQPKKRYGPKQNEYTLVRDFLLWQLSIDNGGRPGRPVEDSDNLPVQCYVINIFKHKTSATHGPARIVFSEQLYNWFKIFVNNIRKPVLWSSDK